MRRHLQLWSPRPLRVWAWCVCGVFQHLCICVKHLCLPVWWMPLFVAQVRRHPWWDRPTVHHSCLSSVAPLHTSIYSLPPIPVAHDEWPVQEMCSLISGNSSSATSFLILYLHLLFHPYISHGGLVVNESPMFFHLAQSTARQAQPIFAELSQITSPLLSQNKGSLKVSLLIGQNFQLMNWEPQSLK